MQISAVRRRPYDSRAAAAELVLLANEGCGRVNITVVVLDVVDDGGVAQRASAALAGGSSGLQSEHDLAGFGTAVDPGLSEEELDSARSKPRSEEHTSELQSLMRISYAVFCLKKKT